jgi:hypothetical protein
VHKVKDTIEKEKKQRALLTIDELLGGYCELDTCRTADRERGRAQQQFSKLQPEGSTATIQQLHRITKITCVFSYCYPE